MPSRTWFPPIILAIVTLIVCSGVVRHGFVDWDDPQLLLLNTRVRSFSPSIFTSYDPELYVPVTLLTYQIEHAVAGLNPVVYHTTNLLLHVINVLLAFALLKTLGGDTAIAFLAALLFAVHPVNAEAVAWVSARKELLSAAFALAALWQYARHSHSRRLRWMPVALFALAMASKPNVILLPLLLPVIDIWHNGRVTVASVRRLWPYWTLMLVFGLIALGGKAQVNPLSLAQVMLLGARSLFFYISKLMIPAGLSAIYPAPADALQWMPGLALIAAAALLVAGVWLTRRCRPVFFGSAMFLLVLAPSFFAYYKSGQITLAADRYAYLASIGFLFALLSAMRLVVRSKRGRQSLTGATLIVTCVLGIAMRSRLAVWHDTKVLFGNVLALYPESHVAKSNLGFALLREDKTDEAIALFTEAIALEPASYELHVNLGAAYGRKRLLMEAEQEALKAIDIDPRKAQAHILLGGVYFTAGELEAARKEYELARTIEPGNPQAGFFLAQILLKQGDGKAAADLYRSVIAFSPEFRGQAPALDALID